MLRAAALGRISCSVTNGVSYMSSRKKKPTKSGSKYSDEEIQETFRFIQLKKVMQHADTQELIRIVRNDITSQWELIRQKKINALTSKFIQKLADDFDIRGSSFSIDMEKRGGVVNYKIRSSTAPRRIR